MFKVIIAGSRDFNDYELLKNKVDFYLSKKVAAGESIIIISGTANGADKLGERYAFERGYPVKRYPADWDRFGRRAGYIRNEEMAKDAHAAIIFWNGSSNGSKHMIDIAKSKKLLLKVVKY